MAYQRPTLAQLRQQARRDMLDAGIPGLNTVLRYSVLGVIADVLAGLSWLHYGYLDFIARQSVPWTSTGSWLESWGALKGVSLKPASKASGQVTFKASEGAQIPLGTSLQVTDVGLARVTDGSMTVDGVIAVQCMADIAGTVGNAEVGTVVTLSSPIAGVQSSGTLTSPMTGGADIEAYDDYRIRVMDAFGQLGEMGTSEDYSRWARSVAGISRAWVAPMGFGPGTVVIYIMLDEANAGRGGYPLGTDGAATEEQRYHTATGDQLRVANAINTRRPVTTLVIVCAPEPQMVDFVIGDMGAAVSDETQERIRNALLTMFQANTAPGATLYPSHWNEALSALGLDRYTVKSPVASVSAKHPGAMLTLGTITYEP